MAKKPVKKKSIKDKLNVAYKKMSEADDKEYAEESKAKRAAGCPCGKCGK